MASLRHDVAHVGHVELLTPEPERSRWFFVQVLGLTETGRDGDSVYLRTWDDYEQFSLKLTGHETSGIAATALRAASQEALERTAKAVGQTGLGGGWVDGEPGIGPTYAFRDPDGHEMRLYWESEWYQAPPELAPALKNQAQAYPARGVGARRLDHVNYLAADVAETTDFVTGLLGARATEQIVLDNGTVSARWLHFASKSYDLVYTEDWTGRRDGCITSRSLPTPARTSCARPTSASTAGCSSKPARTSTPSSRRSSSTSTSRAGTGSSCATRWAG